VKSQEQILLHEDDELSEIIGMSVVSRELIQAWPLSFVERITLSDNTSRIYKSFYNLPVETEFYRQVQSRYIPKVFYNHSDGNQHWLIFEDIDGQPPPENLSQEKALDLARQARKIINEIGSAEPYRFNLSGSDYDSFTSTTIELLIKLRRETKLKKVDETVIARIKETLSHREVLNAVRGRCVLLHGDFSSRNILIRPNGEIVLIDWQSILYGPEDIDIYNFMTYQKFDPVPIAGIAPELLRLALVIRWFAECIDRWLPWPDFYDGKIAKIDEQMCHIVANNGYAGMTVDYFQQ